MLILELVKSQKWRAGCPTVLIYFHRLSSPPGWLGSALGCLFVIKMEAGMCGSSDADIDSVVRLCPWLWPEDELLWMEVLA